MYSVPFGPVGMPRPREKPWFKLGGVELVWQLSCSIYSERQRECDSRAFFDTERLIDAAFLGDVAYSKLDRVVKDPAERAAVLQSCRAYFPLTCSVFRFYCAQAADLQPFSLALNSYTLLMQVPTLLTTSGATVPPPTAPLPAQLCTPSVVYAFLPASR